MSSGASDSMNPMASAFAALHLRLRHDATGVESEDATIEAFLPRKSTPRAPQREEFGVVPGRRPPPLEGPTKIFLRGPEFGIPAPDDDHRLPDLEHWHVRPTTFGWIAEVPPKPRGGRPGPHRATQLLAGCLALALPSHALAQVPELPPAEAPAEAADPTAPIPTESEADPATAAVSVTPAPTPAPTVVPSPAPNPDTSVVDAAWEGVDGFQVIVELAGGKVLRGRVGAVQRDTFTLIDGTTGQILVIPKSSVASLRAQIPAPIPTQTGSGLIAGGAVLTAVATPVFLTGVTFLAICPSCTYLHLPMLIIGAGGLGGGIPMIVKGSRRRAAYQRAINQHQISPFVGRRPHGGWGGGLRLRF